ncbi:MAG TPA: hypothetical protein VFK40_02325 [Nitrososphaeraceae archaeon]|nr:hypothetical protein [Nitrososphaeraceae archaeon]
MKYRNKIHEESKKEIIPSEKWLVSFKKHNKYDLNPKIIIRQFYAQGYFEAYDIVRTFSEKLGLEIIWFKEKRKASDNFLNKTFSMLESVCVYCNGMFNTNEPIPCLQQGCSHIFCSKKCMNNHFKLKHDNNNE